MTIQVIAEDETAAALLKLQLRIDRSHAAVPFQPMKEADAAELMDAMRGKKDGLLGIPGETKTVPFTMTNVEGIGRVDYGTLTFIVNGNSVEAEKRSVFGENLSGYLTLN